MLDSLNVAPRHFRSNMVWILLSSSKYTILFLHRPDSARAPVGGTGPNGSGEAHTPLDYAPSPQSKVRSLFSDPVLGGHLDALAAAQQADGNWMFKWLEWNPATTLEWRAWLTVE